MTLEADLAEHAPFLRALARRLVADAAAAEDLVQETCVAALDRGERRPRNPVAWLSTVLRVRAARRGRTERRRTAREAAVARAPRSPDTATVAAELEVARRLLQHVEALDEPGREVVYLRFYRDRMPRQIAAELGLPVATVKTRLARALVRLRERLDADDPRGRREWLPALAALGGAGPDGGGAPLPGLPVRSGALLRNGLVAAVVVLGAGITVAALWTDPPAPTALPAGTNAPAAAAPTAHDRDARRQTIATTPAPASVRGFVEDASVGAAPGKGVPAAGVVVRYRLRLADGAPRSRSVDGETATDASGRFHIDVPERAELVRVEAPGDARLRAAVWTAWQDLQLPTPLRLTRYLRDAYVGVVVEPSGAPVPDANVRLTHRVDDEKVVVTTPADAHGRFVFADLPDGAWLDAERDGFVQVGARQPRLGPDGAWQPGLVVLAPAATLDVAVVTADGAAAHVPAIALGLASAETGLAAQMDFGRPFRLRQPLTDGRASVSVPAGLQLGLWTSEEGFLGERDGTLVPGDHAAAPIVLAAGERRALRLALGTDAEVRGVVLDPDGAPVAGAEVGFAKVVDGRVVPTGVTESDARGLFVHHVALATDGGPLLVDARTTGLRGDAVLQVTGTAPVTTELRLAPARGLEGRVRDGDGRPVRARLQCRIDVPGLAEPVAYGGHWTTDGDGAFRIVAARDVAHHLEVTSERHATVHLRDLRPGGPALDVVLDRPKAARVRLQPTSRLPIGDVEVRVCRPRTDGDRAATAWPTLTASTPWRHVTPPSPGADRWRCEEIRSAAPAGGLEFWLDEGPAWLAVHGRGPDYAPFACVATGPVTIEPGELTLAVELLPTGSCLGQVRFAPGTAPFAASVALADDAGRLLPVCVSGLDRDWLDVVATSSHGWFALAGIPHGTWELRVGTGDELRRGDARLRQRVVVDGDQTEALVLRL